MAFMQPSGELRNDALKQKGCSTCALGCPTASGIKDFPANIQGRMNSLVAMMGNFRQLCQSQKVSCSQGSTPKLTQEIISEFVKIVEDYQELNASYGQIYPTLKHNLDNMMGLHANDVFNYLVEKTKK